MFFACTQDDAFTVSCTGVFMSIKVTSGNGDDHLDLRLADLGTTIHGGRGNDTITGSEADDKLFGDEGNDYIDGRGSVDELTGGAGADSLYGGPGNDLLHADDGEADTANSCDLSPTGAAGLGGSFDEVYIDDATGDTAHPDCETVHRVGGSTPPAPPVAPTNTALPATPTGEAKVGKELTSTHGTWSGTEPMTFVTQWVRCSPTTGTCTPITGATALTYKVTTDDVNQRLSFTVQAINAGGTSAVASSAQSPVVPKVQSFTPQYAKPTPGDPEQAKGSACKDGEKPTQVGKLFVCYAKAKVIGTDRWSLTGPVTINQAIYVLGADVVIDMRAKTIDANGALTLGVVDDQGTKRRLFSAKRFLVSSTGADAFTIRLTDGQFVGSKRVAGGVPLEVINIAGFAGSQASTIDLKANQKTATMSWAAGFRLMDGAVSGTTTISYLRTRTYTYTLKACAKSPIGVASDRIAELRNACLTYSHATDKWTLDADARLLSTVALKGSGSIVGGGLEAASLSVAGGRVAMPYASYLDEGAINVTGLRSGRPAFGGFVSGGWPYSPNGSGAEVRVTGEVTYDVNARTLTISGRGKVLVGGVELGNGTVRLILGFGANAAPQAASFNADLNALGGFVTGNVTATIDGAGFFASTTATVGFPAGATITNGVNDAIRTATGCAWVPLATCPTVTGLYVQTKVVASSKGIGASGTFGQNPFRVSAAAWWLAASNTWGWRTGFDQAAASLDQLNRSTTGPKRSFLTAQVTRKADGFVVPTGANFAFIRLDGSSTGEIVVRDPNNRVVVDTAAGTYVDGAAFGRDPSGSGAATVLLPGTVMRKGQWKITTGGSPQFTQVDPFISGDVPVAEITKVTVKGAAGSSKLTGGVSKVTLAYTVPSGAKLAIKVANANGSVIQPLASNLRRDGSLTVTVPATWAGPLRFIAATERAGIPVSTTPFPKTYTVVRATLAAPGGVRGSRKGSTARVDWRRVAGAAGYDVQFQVRGSKPATVTSTRTQLVLPTASAATIRVRVRAVTTAGLPGSWSGWKTIAATGGARQPRR